MRIRPYLPSTEHKSGKVLLTVIIAVVLLTGYLGYLYYTVQNDKTETYATSKQIAQKETPLNTVNSVSRYHGMHQYDIVAGVDDNGVKGFAFIPVTDEKEGSVTYVENTDMVVQEEMHRIWEDQCADCSFIEITPAIHQGVPLWEITYRDENNRYVFDYYKMENGKRFEVFRLQQ
ncbi:DUF5590 domain-containing protein [Pontibacillus sp. ALD_SL1]|uniref:cell wall elongation regulator TseB-like domain-containing protein n=1 Tax=Pontibacillus sp. ALD_SL1 TaxID=2777185 RepID=UPI001A9742C6|nr:DUF5590 domain-containing protein [Pontibacillus sp. ALD_SL1]QSS98438.1 DUF5590 domain-containing protein [Pontibacillus sp. ALD_SL1]